MIRVLFILVFILPKILIAEYGAIDTVYSFNPGEGNIIGIEPDVYPMNIFGVPSEIASLKVPENSNSEILSLGISGEIIVGFKNKKLMNIEGPDFTIFENAFETFDGSRIFAEPGEVSISDDGINFFTFPIDNTSLKNCAGITPTNGQNNPYDPNTSGGDSFDIAELGFEYITHIKIKDISQIVSQLPKESKYHNPIAMISGFDLDAIIAFKLEPITTNVNENFYSFKYDEVRVYDLNGRQVYFSFTDDFSIDYFGIYLKIYLNNNHVTHSKVIIQ